MSNQYIKVGFDDSHPPPVIEKYMTLDEDELKRKIHDLFCLPLGIVQRPNQDSNTGCSEFQRLILMHITEVKEKKVDRVKATSHYVALVHRDLILRLPEYFKPWDCSTKEKPAPAISYRLEAPHPWIYPAKQSEISPLLYARLACTQVKRPGDPVWKEPWKMTNGEFEKTVRLMVKYINDSPPTTVKVQDGLPGTTAQISNDTTVQTMDSGGLGTRTEDLTRFMGFRIQRKTLVDGIESLEREETMVMCGLHRRMRNGNLWCLTEFKLARLR